AVGVRRHQKRRPEPDRQRKLTRMHDPPRGHLAMPTTLAAFIGEAFGLQHPTSPTAATWANKPFWPTTLEKVLRTRAFRGKAALKLEQRLRKPALRSRHDTHPCSSDIDEQLTPLFLFCTLDVDWPDACA